VRDPALVDSARASRAVSLLLVEDDVYMAEALQLILERNGFLVTWCEDAQQALEQLQTAPTPALIVLDLWTPNMDGWQFRLEQRRRPALSMIPVIALSADRSARAAAIDADAFLAKPVEEKVLLATIRRVLAEARDAAVSALVREAPAPFAAAPPATPAREIDLGNALYMLLDSLEAASGHCRALVGEVSGIVEARTRAMGTLLGSAQRAAQHMEDVVFRPGTLDRRLAPGMVDVALVLRKSLSQVERELPLDVRIVSDIAPQAFACGDAVKLGQVFVNVLCNACEAMVDSARPTLYLEVWPDAEGAISVSISDSGCGMAPETLERAFDAFYTFGRRRLAQGLGLTVARHLIQAMGGSCELVSSTELGSTVRVCLPRELSREARGERPRAPVAVPSVLVVDDDLRMLAQLNSALSGQFAVTAMRSWQALHHIHAGNAFDLVLYNNTRSETRALSFFAALALKFPAQSGRVVFLQNAHVERRVRRWLEEVGIWQVEDSLIQEGLARRLDRLLSLWSALGLRNPRSQPVPDSPTRLSF